MQKVVLVPLLAALLAACGTYRGAYRTTLAAPPAGWPLVPESRVKMLRLGFGDTAEIGTAVSSTKDTLYFRDARPFIQAVSVRDIRRLEVVQGTRTQKAKGGAIGAALGLLAGGIVGVATYKATPACQPNTVCGDLNSLNVYARGIEGGLLGAATGGIIGVLVGAVGTDRWVPVNVPTSP